MIRARDDSRFEIEAPSQTMVGLRGVAESDGVANLIKIADRGSCWV